MQSDLSFSKGSSKKSWKDRINPFGG